jgi:hypothetical protein
LLSLESTPILSKIADIQPTLFPISSRALQLQLIYEFLVFLGVPFSPLRSEGEGLHADAFVSALGAWELVGWAERFAETNADVAFQRVFALVPGAMYGHLSALFPKAEDVGIWSPVARMGASRLQFLR